MSEQCKGTSKWTSELPSTYVWILEYSGLLCVTALFPSSPLLFLFLCTHLLITIIGFFCLSKAINFPFPLLLLLFHLSPLQPFLSLLLTTPLLLPVYLPSASRLFTAAMFFLSYFAPGASLLTPPPFLFSPIHRCYLLSFLLVSPALPRNPSSSPSLHPSPPLPFLFCSPSLPSSFPHSIHHRCPFLFLFCSFNDISHV